MNLFRAIELGDVEVARALMKAGHDPDAADELGAIPLLEAVRKGQEEIVRVLIDGGADLNVRDAGGDTPLIAATREENPALVQMLLDAGAGVDAQDMDGNSALAVAVSEHHEGLVRVLVEAGVDVNCPDHRGKTPLIDAAFGQNTIVVELLLRAGADPNLQDLWGYTAVIWAASEGYADIVASLLSAGADVRVRNHEGETALQRAHMSERPSAPEIIEMLREAEDVQCWNKKTSTDEPPGTWSDAVRLTQEEDLLPSVEDEMLAMMEEETGGESGSVEGSETSATALKPEEDLLPSVEDEMLTMMQEEMSGESEGVENSDPSVDEPGEDLSDLLEDMYDPEKEDTGEAERFVMEHQADVFVANWMGFDPGTWPTDRLVQFCTCLSALAKANGPVSLFAYQPNAHLLLRDIIEMLNRFAGDDMAVLDWHLSRRLNLPLRPESIRDQLILDFFAQSTYRSGRFAAMLRSYYRRVDFGKWQDGIYAPYLRKTVRGNYAITGPGGIDFETSDAMYSLCEASLDELVGALASLSELVRREGFLGLEKFIGTYKETLLNEGFRLALEIDTYSEAELLRAYLTAYSAQNQMHLHLLRITVLEVAAGYNPGGVERRLGQLAGAGR
ncbi:MAG: ankyrin repeat domain-containing protein [bacterium]|nr:ankyrin repeat domain-containing protein [bacterium]